MNNRKPIVQMGGICKRFGNTQALDEVNLKIYTGSIIGLLGSNGAGKSTLLRHIIGLYLPDRGKCVTFDTDAKKLGPKQFERIGYVHQEGQLLNWMKVKQLIRYVSAYYPNWNSGLEERYISDFEVSTKARVGSLSPGERQKLAILLAIGFEPELLILDEPASALDPIARANFLNLLLELIQDESRTIIISSHILSDVEKVMDHVVIMKSGRILRDCSFDSLREQFHRVHISTVGETLPAELPFANVVQSHRSNGQAVLTVRESSRELIEQQAQELNCQVDIQPLSLEDIYRIVMS